MFAHVLKGAPLGNKNAAGPHKGAGGSPKHPQGSAASHQEAYKKGIAAGRKGAFSSDSPYPKDQSEHEHWVGGLDEGRNQTSKRRKTDPSWGMDLGLVKPR